LPAKIRNAEIQMSKFKALSCFGHSYSVLLNAITPAIDWPQGEGNEAIRTNPQEFTGR
jgi:hypothetical protein